MMGERIDRQTVIRYSFLVVYAAVSLATFYHSAWGFATLQGAIPDDWLGRAGWWAIGGLMAFAVDVGMGVIVFGLISGWQAGWLIAALIVLATASGFTQLIYAAHHAAVYSLGEVADWLWWLGYVLDARVIALPLMLPVFALIYAFAAKLHPDNYLTETSPEPNRKTTENEPEIRKPDRKPALPEPETKPEIPETQAELTGTQAEVLRCITENQPITPGDIAAVFGRKASFTARHTKPLEEAGLVTKNADGQYVTIPTNGKH